MNFQRVGLSDFDQNDETAVNVFGKFYKNIFKKWEKEFADHDVNGTRKK